MNTTSVHRQWFKATAWPMAALLLALAGCGTREEAIQVDLADKISEPDMASAPLKPGEYRFGFDLRSSPQEDGRQYQPFLDYLGKATGYKFRLHFMRKDMSVAEQMGNGTVQFASMGAVSSVRAQVEYAAVQIARGLNKEGKPVYRAMIVVAPNSPIISLAELRGKRMAFGDINSTQGHIIPRIMLHEAGLGLRDLSEYQYTGSHRSCANAVISGKADACGMQDTMAESLASEKLLRILKASREYPAGGITASRKVPPEVVEKVRRALLDFEPQGRHAQGLYNWDKTEMPRGFTATSPNDYAELRGWLVRLDMLPEAKAK